MLNNTDWRDCKVERGARGSKIIPQFLWESPIISRSQESRGRNRAYHIRLSLITKEERIEELQRNCTLRIGR
jgi:hypothetical protein